MCKSSPMVTMNRTLKKVMHTITNATNCFQEAKLHYITNQYIRVDVSPLQCTIPIDSTLQVQLQYFVGSSFRSIDFSFCTVNCSEEEYQQGQTFMTTKKYVLNYSLINDSQRLLVDDFFLQFKNNRQLTINIQFTFLENGIPAVAVQDLYQRNYIDYLDCATGLYHWVQVNDNNVRLMLRDVDQNQFNCIDGLNVTQVVSNILIIG